MRRRTFLKTGIFSTACLAAGSLGRRDARAAAPERPNVLWISAEDISPDLGCYGDEYAVTPNIDNFAQRAVRYDRAYSHSGVCAPSRSGIITGMYPTSIGTHHMRCSGVPPAGVKCFPEYLRAAGYFCTNNRKTDYQFSPPLSAWDENSGRAHWRHRPEGMPFFSVFNIGICHESQVRSNDPKRLAQIEALGNQQHDPAKAPVPPYHADTKATRDDWAQYYDVITLMDQQVGRILKELEEDGLAEDTIVWFWGDHGRGLTRGKRWLYESGTRIPLLVHVPEKWRDWVCPTAPETLGRGTRDDMVCFIDFAPTMLSLAGVSIPTHMQGQAFLGKDEASPRAYVYGARDRMDEAYDLIRTVRDKRFRYFRNYMPYVTYAQDIEYMNKMPMLQDLRRLHREGKLDADQERWFASRKPLEELYDVEADPHELNNLADDPAYADVLARLRTAHLAWMEETGDVGLVPEPIYDAWKWQAGTPMAAPPVVREDEGKLAMHAPTPGASICYRWEDDPSGRWRLYSVPIPVRDGVAVRAKAVRVGFEDSPEVNGVSGERDATGHPAVGHPVDAGYSTASLQRLSALRALDGAADASVSSYLDAMSSADPAMRYWGLVPLHRLVDAKRPEPGWKDAAVRLLTDEAPAVRIAAAHALCDWDVVERGLDVLRAELQHESQSARLFAATALKQLGSTAAAAVPALKAATGDPSIDVGKVARSALADLEEG